MKQVVLAVLAFFLVISMYAVFTSLQDIGIFDEHNLTMTDKAPNDVSNVKDIDTKKPKVNKAGKKSPAVTRKSKQLFLKKTIAAIKKVKSRLDAEYQMVYELSLKKSLSDEERAKIEQLKKRYKVEDFPCLLKRLHPHPVSIVIAQAALESGWGSSRFYREANNIFGVWSFNPKESRMAAGVAREGQKTIYVKKYPSLEASIESYYRMMAKGRAFKQFRTARLHTDNPFEIIPYLDHYSELRHEYVRRLYYVIKSNKFYKLDEPQYQPPGWASIKPAKKEYLVPKKEKPADQVADKCKKDGKSAIQPIDSDKDMNSSRAIDLTALTQDTNTSENTIDANISEKSVMSERREDTNSSV